MDLEGISTNGKGEVIEGKRLPTNRFPKSAGYIKDEIANGKTDICTIDQNWLRKIEINL
ncbi:hypothetical protein [Bacillus wiedmannii]|uniref:hypothetical protein n=1 Tax=Bacillus wiedmannii TaxID=1890302 RepID=UPI000AEE7BC5|nr:hypothetical protein [Bacillus wiedmannii]